MTVHRDDFSPSHRAYLGNQGCGCVLFRMVLQRAGQPLFADCPMTELPASEAKRSLPPKWVLSILGALAAFGTLAMFEFLSGHPFLPSPEWVAYALWAALVAGMASSAFAFWFLRHHDKKNVFHFKDEVVELGHLFGSLVLLALYFGFGYMSALKIVPMFETILMGHRLEASLTVQYTMPWASRFCGRSVVFAELPFGVDTICDLRPDLLERLAPGTRVVVSGRGTAWGVFVDHLRVAESAE